MNIKCLTIFFLILFSIFTVCRGLCLDSEDIIRLKEAGISNETIQSIYREKSIETCAISVQEILRLKKAGLNDETIRMIIEEGSFQKDREPIIYGKEIRSIRVITVDDIIKLKQEGLSNEVIRAVINVGSENTDNAEREKAWDMLRNMGIIEDMRGVGD